MHAPEIDGKVFVNDVRRRTATAYPASSTAARSPKRHDYDLVAKII